MGTRKRQPVPHTDEQILADPRKMELLEAVHQGEVVRGTDGISTAVSAPHYWAGRSVRLDVGRLRDDELVRMPISGPPVLDERGRLLLQLAQPSTANQWCASETWADL